jgi:acetyltransferase-like isoleucine patch superfamily enzyme
VTAGHSTRELRPDELSGGVVGENVSIRCVRFEAAGSFKIGNGVEIEAEVIQLGDGAEIGNGTTVRAIRGRTELLSMGDQALLDESCNIIVPRFECGDYTRIFRNALISGYKPVTLGHNCWVGQGAIFNSAEILTIGNNVRMGGSQIWTHVASGEVLEGSRFYGEAPVVVEDDVWLMGFGHLISPGVTLARGTVVMACSVVSKSTEAYHTYSGIPARDVTDKLPAWDHPTAEEKWEKLTSFVKEFAETQPQAADYVALAADSAALGSAVANEGSHLIFAREVADWDAVARSRHSVFDLATKTYWKQRTPLEVAWHHFALGFRARFLPRNASKTSSSKMPAS